MVEYSAIFILHNIYIIPKWVHNVLLYLLTKHSSEQIVLCVSMQPNWGIMDIPVQGMFAFQEKAKPQISPPQRDTWKPVPVAEQPCPKSILQRSLLFQSYPSLGSLFTVCAVSTKYRHFCSFCGTSYQWKEGTVSHIFSNLLMIQIMMQIKWEECEGLVFMRWVSAYVKDSCWDWALLN